MAKKAISLLLIISLLVVMSFQSYAFSNIDKSEAIKSEISFIDGEGKENTIILTILGHGRVHSEHFIEGKLLNKVDATTDDGEHIDFTISDQNARNKKLSLNASTLLGNKEVKQVIPRITLQSFTYVGAIYYKTYYDMFGNAYNNMLYIYQQKGSAYDTYRTLNATEGILVNILISAVAAVLTVICPALAAVANDLVLAAAYAAGVSIVGGVIQGAISKTYYVRVTPYDIRAVDPSTSRSRTYEGETYKLYLEGGGFSSETFYDCYLPWNSNAVAYWMYCDFWDGNNYPGVRNFS